MSAGVGLVEIMISCKYEGEDLPRNIYARLLTPELEAVCRRQNIDTADINSLKWPIFGLSRYATAKILVLRSDLFRLLMDDPNDWGTETSFVNGKEFRISFISGSAANQGTMHFNRMFLANITPIAVTANGFIRQMPVTDDNGDPVIDPDTGEQQIESFSEGEALYILTFHDARWHQRGARISKGSYATSSNEKSPRSWRDDVVLDSPQVSIQPTLIVRKIVTTLLSRNAITNDGIFLSGTDTYNDRYENWDVADFPFQGSPDQGWKVGFPGMDSETSRPMLEFADYLMVKCRVAMHVRPIGGISPPGQYEFNVLGYSRGNLFLEEFQDYMSKYGDDLISGSVFGNRGDFSDPDIKWAGRIISYFPFNSFAEESVNVAVRKSNIPDGRAPSVFKVDHFGRLVLNEQDSLYLPNPFSQSIPLRIYDASIYTAHNRTWSTIFADEPLSKKQLTIADERENRDKTTREESPPGTPQAVQGLSSRNVVDLAEHYSEHLIDRRRHQVCDLWFRGWIEIPPPNETWLGASWIEYRLQTDSNGFGFPTTRIYGDYYDPMFVPQADDRPLEVSTSGLAKSWRDARGKNHISVNWPFGIPCLIKITGNTGQFNAGVKAWSYQAKLIYKGVAFDNSSGQYPPPPSDPLSSWPGQLKDFSKLDPTWADQTIVAYNLAELANTSTFAGPGYKLPLAQNGFDILPIGLDRLGEQHEVIVQATLYMSVGYEDTDNVNLPADRPVAYFCLTNAIDGDCPTPLTDNTYDGGVY